MSEKNTQNQLSKDETIIEIRDAVKEYVDLARGALSDGFQFWGDVAVFCGIAQGVFIIISRWNKKINDKAQLIEFVIEALRLLEDEYNWFDGTVERIKASLPWGARLLLKLPGVGSWLDDREKFLDWVKAILEKRL